MIDQVIAFVAANSVLIAAAVVAVLDLVFAINPNTQANGLLHFLYLQAKKLLPSKPS